MRLFPLFAAIAFIGASPATAKTMTFRATLTGIAPPTATGSPARGSAIIKVDTTTKKVSVDLDVTGITLDQLNDGLVAKPVGPIHFHVYRTADDVELILPLPYGPNYKATGTGFRVTVRGYDYETGAKLLNTGASFDEFVNAMRGQRALLDIHTDKFPDGEISGKTLVR
ncbi:CHRD domain-containing protein [Sphingomonas sp.]|uniref:CHRD domain-containing protein n=1 Tax=Sphingomonas sp. TaxID=28214 RepID=UPI0025D22084|nr:CHRD domain-containing protein [Sphingomonas sp.]